MTIKGKPKVAKNQPKTGLIRFEFVEMLWRLGLKKYFDSIYKAHQNSQGGGDGAGGTADAGREALDAKLLSIQLSGL